jgi:peptidoglycan/LPS O-acetylase OafA/YrhL
LTTLQQGDLAPPLYSTVAGPDLVADVPVAKSKASGRIEGLDGLRALAVLIVFCSHYCAYIFPSRAGLLEKVFPGMLGVALFFAISGFLISALLLREYRATKHINLKNFYIRRLLRLTPALYIYVAVTFIAYLIVDKNVRVSDFMAALLYVSNYYQMIQHTTLYYMPLWSLAIEEHFYLLFPLFLLTVMRWSPSALVPTLIGLIVLQFFWRFHVASLPHMDWRWVYSRTDTRLDSLLFGVLLTTLATTAGFERVRAAIASGPSGLFSIALLAISVADRNEIFRMSARYTLQGAALVILIAFIVYNTGRIAKFCRRFLEIPILVYIGQISYSLYLWHLTILKFFVHVLGNVSPILAIALALVSVGMAALSYRFIETPFLNLRHRFGSHAAA